MGLKNMEGVHGLDLPTTEKFVLLVLAWKINDDGSPGYPSEEWLGITVGVARKTIYRTIKKLESRSLIQVSRKKFKPNRYTLLPIPSGSPMSHDSGTSECPTTVGHLGVPQKEVLKECLKEKTGTSPSQQTKKQLGEEDEENVGEHELSDELKEDFEKMEKQMLKEESKYIQKIKGGIKDKNVDPDNPSTADLIYTWKKELRDFRIENGFGVRSVDLSDSYGMIVCKQIPTLISPEDELAGRVQTYSLYQNVLPNWGKFMDYVLEKNGEINKAKEPNPNFLWLNIQHAIDFAADLNSEEPYDFDELNKNVGIIW